MSGIFGVCQPGATIFQRELEPMLASLSLPDEAGHEFASFPSACLGVARRWAFQQTATIPGYAIALDAEIYNRQELASFVHPSGGNGSDYPLAVLLAMLYRERGPSFVQ